MTANDAKHTCSLCMNNELEMHLSKLINYYAQPSRRQQNHFNSTEARILPA